MLVGTLGERIGCEGEVVVTKPFACSSTWSEECQLPLRRRPPSCLGTDCGCLGSGCGVACIHVAMRPCQHIGGIYRRGYARHEIHDSVLWVMLHGMESTGTGDVSCVLVLLTKGVGVRMCSNFGELGSDGLARTFAGAASACVVVLEGLCEWMDTYEFHDPSRAIHEHLHRSTLSLLICVLSSEHAYDDQNMNHLNLS